MKFTLIILISLLNTFHCFAQNELDSIQNKIIKNRESIHKRLISNHLDSIKTKELINKRVISFVNIEEEELLDLIIGNYSQLLEKIALNESFTHKKSNLRIFKYKSDQLKKQYNYARWYAYDSLGFEIYNYLKTHRNDIQSKINSSNINQESKKFLNTYLLFYIFRKDFCNSEIEQEMLHLSRSLNQKDSNSSLGKINEKYFNVEYEKSKWGTGAYFMSGQIIPTGNLSNYFSNAIPIGLGLNINFDKVYFFAGFGASIGSKIKQDLYFQKNWNKGDKAIYPQGELLIGYNIIDKKRLGITPFVGIGGTAISPYKPNDENSYYDDVDGFSPNNILTYGVNFDFRWGRTNCNSKVLYGRGAGKDFVYAITRLSIGYNNPQYEKTLSTLGGSLWFVKIGIAYQNQFKRKVKKRL